MLTVHVHNHFTRLYVPCHLLYLLVMRALLCLGRDFLLVYFLLYLVCCFGSDCGLIRLELPHGNFIGEEFVDLLQSSTASLSVSFKTLIIAGSNPPSFHLWHAEEEEKNTQEVSIRELAW
jgi:hypothetical protein